MLGNIIKKTGCSSMHLDIFIFTRKIHLMIEIIHPSGNRKVKLEQMKDKNGASIEVAAGSPTHVWIPVDGPVEGGLLARMF